MRVGTRLVCLGRVTGHQIESSSTVRRIRQGPEIGARYFLCFLYLLSFFFLGSWYEEKESVSWSVGEVPIAAYVKTPVQLDPSNCGQCNEQVWPRLKIDKRCF